MAIQIQLRGGTAAEWTAANPILADREIGVERITNLYKIGDGVTPWNSLGYYTLAPILSFTTLLVQSSEPSEPSSGNMHLYAKSIANRALPKIKGPSGLDTALQPAFFSNGIQMYLPGTTTVMNVIGGPALTVVGTLSHPALLGTNLRTQTSRASVLSAAVVNSAAELRVASTRVWRGNIEGGGGFFHRTRFSISSAILNQRVFIGFTPVTTAIAVTQEPNLLVNMIGIGNGLGSTSLSIFSNDASGVASEIPLGPDFMANDLSAIYDFTLFCPPNDNSINYEVKNLTKGVSVSGVITTDLPIETVFLAYHAYINNGGTASSVSLDIMRIYTETDY